jgi:hypothetical protein
MISNHKKCLDYAWQPEKRTFYAPNMSSTVRPSHKHKTGLPVQINVVQIGRLFSFNISHGLRMGLPK